MAEWLIKLLVPPRGVVIDPFVGSGSTAVATANTGRRFVGAHINADYVRIAQRRLAEIDSRGPATSLHLSHYGRRCVHQPRRSAMGNGSTFRPAWWTTRWHVGQSTAKSETTDSLLPSASGDR